MGKKGASKKLSSKNNDRGILGIKKAIVRKGDTVIGSATPSVHSGRTRLPQSEVFLEQVQEDAARFEHIKDLSLGKLKKRHVMETRELRRTVEDMRRGKFKEKKHTLNGKKNRKEIGKEIQRLEREQDERQKAEIDHLTRRNQRQKLNEEKREAAYKADPTAEADDLLDEMQGQKQVPSFSFGKYGRGTATCLLFKQE